MTNIDEVTDDSRLTEQEISEEFARRLLRAAPEQIRFDSGADWRGLKQAVEFLIEVRLQQAETDNE